MFWLLKLIFFIQFLFFTIIPHAAKKILVLADAIGTHYNFALNIAEVLHANGDHVHFLVVKYDDKELKAPSLGIQFDVVRFRPDKEYEGKYPRFEASTNWTVEKSFPEAVFFNMLKFNMFSFYKAIIEKKKIFDLLLADAPTYDLGIAEFGISYGPVSMFHRIGLKNFILTTAAPPFPAISYFLGQRVSAEVPRGLNSMPGDGNNNSKIRDHNSDRYKENVAAYRRSIPKYVDLFNRQYQECYENAIKWAKRVHNYRPIAMPPMLELVRRARFFAINSHPLARLPVPVSDRIKFIGGMEVEKMGIISEKFAKNSASENVDLGEDEWIKTSKCVVIFSLGTMVGFEGFDDVLAANLFNAFAKHPECKFLVRIDEEKVANIKEHYGRMGVHNIIIRDNKKLIKQQEIMAHKNVHGMIIHCGQNSLNEILYAGIPVICIPFFGDQFTNSAVAEYMGIGIWVEHTKFVEQFDEALEKLLGTNKMEKSVYKKRAEEIAKIIYQKPFEKTKEFLEMVKIAAEEKVDENSGSVFPAVEAYGDVPNEEIRIPDFEEILKQLSK